MSLQQGLHDLSVAARSGDAAGVESALRNNSRITNNEKFYPLQSACEHGHLEAVKLLLDSGASLSLKDTYVKFTPLSIAVENGHLDIVKLLVEGRGAAVEEKGSGWNILRTPLSVAAEKGHFAIVEYLLDRGARVDFPYLNSGTRPLWIAASRQHVEVVKLLLKRGADVNRRTKHGNTPLAHAACCGRLAMVKLLLDAGANVDFATPNGTPLSLASYYGHVNVVKELLDRGADINPNNADRMLHPLCAAAMGGSDKAVRLLLERGAKIDMVARTETALALAASYGRSTVAKTLINKGANVNFEFTNGETVLNAAARTGKNSLVKLLLDNGARVDVGKSPISAAILHLDTALLLLDAGASVNTEDGKYLLENSLMYNRLDAAQRLLKTVPKVAEWQHKAMYFATKCEESGSYEVLKQLLESPQVVDWLSPEELTAFQCAFGSNQTRKMWLLALNGASTLQYDLKFVTSSEKEILLHFWTPQNHKYHPPWARDAIKCTLLVAKQQNWPFDQLLLYHLLSFVAYGWYKRLY